MLSDNPNDKWSPRYTAGSESPALLQHLGEQLDILVQHFRKRENMDVDFMRLHTEMVLQLLQQLKDLQAQVANDHPVMKYVG